MKSIKLALVLAVALLAVMSVSVVSAAGGKWGNGVENQKATLYAVPSGDSSNAVVNDQVRGKVIVVNPLGATTLMIQGNATGLDADDTYTVWVRDIEGYTGPKLIEYLPLGYFALTTFVADELGNGSFHINLPADQLPNGDYEIQVAINTTVSGGNGYTVAATPWGADKLLVTLRSAQ